MITAKAVAKLSFAESRDQLAQLSKGLAHPARVQIVNMLANRPKDAKCICGDIVDALPLSQSTVSQHLKILKRTGWIRGEIDRPRICYCLIEGVIDRYLALLGYCLKQT